MLFLILFLFVVFRLLLKGVVFGFVDPGFAVGRDADGVGGGAAGLRGGLGQLELARCGGGTLPLPPGTRLSRFLHID